MNYEDILFWFFIGFLIIAVIALAFFMFYSLYRMGKFIDAYNKYAEEEMKKGNYVPPLPAAR